MYISFKEINGDRCASCLVTAWFGSVNQNLPSLVLKFRHLLLQFPSKATGWGSTRLWHIVAKGRPSRLLDAGVSERSEGGVQRRGNEAGGR